MKAQILVVLVLAIFLLSTLPAVTAKPEQAPGLSVAIERLSQLKEKVVSRAAATEEIREFQQERLQTAIERCRIQNLSPERCETKLQARLNLVSKLKNISLTVLQRVQENKDTVIQKLIELRNSTHFGKFKERVKDFIARNVTQRALERARERFELAKEKFNQTRERLQLVKTEFNQTREQLRLCLENETTECQELREQIRLHAQRFLNKTLNLIESHLEKIRSRVESSKTLTENETSETLADIEAKLTQLEGLRDRVAAITENTTKEEIRNLTLEIRDLWKDEIKQIVDHAAGFVQLNRMGGIYVKMRHLERRLNDVLEKMAEQEKSTAELETLVEQFNSKLGETESHYKLAQEKFREASLLRGTERNAAIQEAQSHMRETKADLKEAHQILKDIIQGFVEQDVEQELEEEEEAEQVLEEQEDELAEEGEA